ncbi:MAG: trypsin-like peptidase domain-containing protein [Acidobacteriaceae bacterium]|nr:trypsin-like peptidase domain-containing protein [Acidobacteriaceae bacterium]
METSTSKSPLLNRIRNHRMTTAFGLLALLSAGILAGSVLTRGVSAKEQAVNSSDAKPLVIPAPVDLSNGFSHIVQQVGPAVVNINTEQLPKQPQQSKNRRRGGNDDQQGDMQDLFRRFFGGQGGDDGDDDDNPFGGGMGGGTRRALGSGFIVDPSGYIITNNHVVDHADKIYVKLSTDREDTTDQGRPAHVVGTDKETDIAVIKIDTDKPLPTIKLGNSDEAQVGDWVLAIGSPFGLKQTVSAGIVSAKNRPIDEPTPTGISNSGFQHFIQTDAAINPGNSGGPLVDMAGNVIGMNTAIFTQSGSSAGIGFAMPSNTIVSVYNALIGPDHKVVRGSIGITFRNMYNPAVARQYGEGVMVSSVNPGSGAAKAGLQPNDVIVSVDDQKIKNGDDLINIVSSRKVGSTVKLGFLRDGKAQTANVAIGDRSKMTAEITGDSDDSDSAKDADAGQATLGITVDAIPPGVAQRAGVSNGVIVTSVKPGSFADDIGLARGTIITEINRKPISDKSSYNTVVSALKSHDDVVFVTRDPKLKSGNNVIGGTLP